MEHSIRENSHKFGRSAILPLHSGLISVLLVVIGGIAVGNFLELPAHLIRWAIGGGLLGSGVLWILPAIRGPHSPIIWGLGILGVILAGLGTLTIWKESSGLLLAGTSLILVGWMLLGGSLSMLPRWTTIQRGTRLVDALMVGGGSVLVLLEWLPPVRFVNWLGIATALALLILGLHIILCVHRLWYPMLHMLLLGGIIVVVALIGSRLLPSLTIPLLLLAAVYGGWAGLLMPHPAPPPGTTAAHEPLWLAILPYLAWSSGMVIAGSADGIGLLLVSGLWLRIGLALHSERTLARHLKAAIADESQIRLLLAGNAHNIKHPLANIQAYLTYLKTHSQRPREQSQLILESTIPALEENAALLMDRIKEMLEIARHAVVPVQCRPIPLSTLYEALHSMVLREQRSSTPHLQATVRCDTDETMIVWTDVTAVCWCVENLIRNAIQAQRDQPTAIVTIRLAAGNTTRLVMVEDTGPGFPQAVLESGYATNAETAVLGGGLGLLGVQATVRQLGGALHLTNRIPPVTGAIATLRLPMKG